MRGRLKGSGGTSNKNGFNGLAERQRRLGEWGVIGTSSSIVVAELHNSGGCGIFDKSSCVIVYEQQNTGDGGIFDSSRPIFIVERQQKGGGRICSLTGWVGISVSGRMYVTLPEWLGL